MGEGVVSVFQDFLCKIAELEAGSFHTGDLVSAFHNRKEAGVLLCGIFRGTAQGRCANAPFRDVDNAAHSDIIPAVVNGFQIGKNVLDLAACIEIGAAHDIVGDGTQYKALLKETGLGVGAVEYCKAVVAAAFVRTDPVLDVLRNEGRLLHCGCKGPDMDAGALTVVGPEGLVLAGAVVFDHRVGCVQYVLGGAVILLQADHHGVRVDLFKIQDISDVGAAEFIDRLVIVAYDAEIFVLAGKKADQLELGGIGILIFVHHDIAEAVLVHLQYFIVRMEKLHSQHQQIVEIQGVVFAQQPLVLLVGHADLFFSEADAVILLAVLQRTQKFVFCTRNIGQDLSLPQVFGVDPEGLAGLFHEGFLVIRIVDGKRGLISHEVDMPAQDADTHGVEGGDPDTLGIAAQYLVDTLTHLSRRLVGKCYGQDVPGVHFAFVDQVGDAVGDDAGLAAAGAGQDQDRALGLEAGLLLLAVECFVDGHIYVSFVIFPCQKSDQSVSRSFSIKSFLI